MLIGVNPVYTESYLKKQTQFMKGQNKRKAIIYKDLQ